MRKKAYMFSRDAVWKEVSEDISSFQGVQLNRPGTPSPHSYVENIKAITNFELRRSNSIT